MPLHPQQICMYFSYFAGIQCVITSRAQVLCLTVCFFIFTCFCLGTVFLAGCSGKIFQTDEASLMCICTFSSVTNIQPQRFKSKLLWPSCEMFHLKTFTQYFSKLACTYFSEKWAKFFWHICSSPIKVTGTAFVHITTWEMLNEFSWNLMLKNFTQD